MKSYQIVKKKEGRTWDDVPFVPIDIWEKNPVDWVFATAKMMWDEEGLYVRLQAVESEIRAVEENPLGATWDDSCLEFFFSPIWGDSRYFNIETTSKPCIYWGFSDCIEHLIRLIPEEHEVISPEVEMTSDGWMVTYFVPAETIRMFFPEFRLYPGKKFRGNFYKCGDKTSRPHFLMWNPIEGSKTTFHQPQYFGELCCVEE